MAKEFVEYIFISNSILSFIDKNYHIHVTFYLYEVYCIAFVVIGSLMMGLTSITLMPMRKL